MRTVETVVANTMVDSQNERMSREALTGLVDSITRHIVPMGIEHDPRIPPVGRVVSGFVRDRPDGESEAVVVCEVFESDDDLNALTVDDRVLVIHDDLAPGALEFSYDFTYRHDEDQADIQAIAAVLGSSPRYEVKKSADPISVLTLAGAFVLGGIATGFLNAVGTDGWQTIKSHLARLAERRASRSGEQLLVFRAVVRDSGGCVIEANTVLSDPTPEQVDRFFSAGLAEVDDLVNRAMAASREIRQLTMSSDGTSVQIEFGIRRDGVPLGIEDTRRGH